MMRFDEIPPGYLDANISTWRIAGGVEEKSIGQVQKATAAVSPYQHGPEETIERAVCQFLRVRIYSKRRYSMNARAEL